MILDIDVDMLFQLIADADWRLERLLIRIRSDISEPLSLSAAAALCGLETTYFSRYFRLRTGMTYSDWYRRVRIGRAQALLSQPRTKIELIPEAVGYGHITSFERAFRKCTGLCPTEYKELLRSRRRTQN